MNKHFNEKDFFKYIKYCLEKEATSGSDIWTNRTLMLVDVVNSIYNKANEEYGIAKITDNYQHLFILDTLNYLFLQEPKLLNTKELTQYLISLPAYDKNKPIQSTTYENHAFLIMSIERHFYNYIFKNSLLIDKLSSCPYVNYHIYDEKKQLENLLLNSINNNKSNNKI